MNTAQARIEEVVNQFATNNIPKNIYGFQGPTRRGPISNPKDIITSWSQFERIFGGLDQINDFPLLCKRAIERGAALRVNNVKHYTTITNASTLDAVKSTFGDSIQIKLASALVAGQVMQATVNGNAKTQAFSNDSKTTMALLAATLMKDLPAIVEYARAISDTQMVIVPKPSVALVVTSVPTGAGAPVSTVTSFGVIDDATGQELFRLKPKNAGGDYNNVLIDISPSINGDVNSFDLTVTHLKEDFAKEIYTGLKIPGKPTIVESSFLDKIVKSSYILDVEYLNLSGLAGTTLTPQPISLRFEDGSDGSALSNTDYIGSSSSKTGFQAFNGYDDIRWLSAPLINASAIHLAGDAYASARKDLEYHAHLSNASSTEDALITERDGVAVNSSYTRFFAGGLIIIDPFTGADKNISEMGDVAGIVADSSNRFGPWFSASGARRGIVTNAKGVVNNFGAYSNIPNLNRLASRQINTVIVRDGKILLWGNFTAQSVENSLAFANVRSLLIEMKKSLGPRVYNFIEEPNDIPTWKEMYQNVQPYLESLKTKRAIFSYNWQGDQFANTLKDLAINTEADVQLGKYKVKLFIKEIVSLQDLLVEITLTPSGVSFEDSLDTKQ